MTVRDFLKPVGKKPRAYFWGESAECSTVYRDGIPRGFIPNCDRVTRDSSRLVSANHYRPAIQPENHPKPVKSSPRCFFSDECADCSAAYHPDLADSIVIRRDFFSGKVDELIEDWAEIRREEQIKEERVRQACSVFLMALQDPHYTSPQKYALQSAHS